MRFFPRNAKSRADALGGSGHLGNHGAQDRQTAADRLKRYDPSVDLTKVEDEYGGSKDEQ
jgi:hypothetical protein